MAMQDASRAEGPVYTLLFKHSSYDTVSATAADERDCMGSYLWPYFQRDGPDADGCPAASWTIPMPTAGTGLFRIVYTDRSDVKTFPTPPVSIDLLSYTPSGDVICSKLSPVQADLGPESADINEDAQYIPYDYPSAKSAVLSRDILGASPLRNPAKTADATIKSRKIEGGFNLEKTYKHMKLKDLWSISDMDAFPALSISTELAPELVPMLILYNMTSGTDILDFDNFSKGLAAGSSLEQRANDASSRPWSASLRRGSSSSTNSSSSSSSSMTLHASPPLAVAKRQGKDLNQPMHNKNPVLSSVPRPTLRRPVKFSDIIRAHVATPDGISYLRESGAAREVLARCIERLSGMESILGAALTHEFSLEGSRIANVEITLELLFCTPHSTTCSSVAATSAFNALFRVSSMVSEYLCKAGLQRSAILCVDVLSRLVGDCITHMETSQSATVILRLLKAFFGQQTSVDCEYCVSGDAWASSLRDAFLSSDKRKDSLACISVCDLDKQARCFVSLFPPNRIVPGSISTDQSQPGVSRAEVMLELLSNALGASSQCLLDLEGSKTLLARVLLDPLSVTPGRDDPIVAAYVRNIKDSLLGDLGTDDLMEYTAKLMSLFYRFRVLQYILFSSRKWTIAFGQNHGTIGKLLALHSYRLHQMDESGCINPSELPSWVIEAARYLAMDLFCSYTDANRPVTEAIEAARASLVAVWGAIVPCNQSDPPATHSQVGLLRLKLLLVIWSHYCKSHSSTNNYQTTSESESSPGTEHVTPGHRRTSYPLSFLVEMAAYVFATTSVACMFRYRSNGGDNQSAGAAMQRSKAVVVGSKSKGREDLITPSTAKPADRRSASLPRYRAAEYLDSSIVLSAIAALHSAWDLLHVWMSEETLDDRIMASFDPLAIVISVLTHCLRVLMLDSEVGLKSRLLESKDLYIEALERVSERAALSGDVLKTIFASHSLPKGDVKSEFSANWAKCCLAALSGCIEMLSKLYE
jgi:hypothetical protein